MERISYMEHTWESLALSYCANGVDVGIKLPVNPKNTHTALQTFMKSMTESTLQTKRITDQKSDFSQQFNIGNIRFPSNSW